MYIEGGPPAIYRKGDPPRDVYIERGPPRIYTWGYRHACSTGVLGVRWCNTLIHPSRGGGAPMYIEGGGPPLHIHTTTDVTASIYAQRKHVTVVRDQVSYLRIEVSYVGSECDQHVDHTHCPRMIPRS